MKKFFFILILFIVCKTSFGSNEKLLADVKIKSNSVNVLNKFGDPTEITIQNYDKQNLKISLNFGQLYSFDNSNYNIKWIYQYKNYILKFVIDSHNKIDSIEIFGNSSPYKTYKNIKLNSYYSDVLKAYGMPLHEYEDEKTIKLEYPKYNLNFVVDKNISNLKSTYRVKIIELNSIN